MKHRITFFAFVAIAACSVALFAQQPVVEPAPEGQTAAVIPAVTTEPDNTTDLGTNGQQLPRFIDFGSKQCKACKAMEPILASLEQKYSDKFKTEFVDVWVPENETLAKSYGIETIPVQVFLNAEGKEVYRNTGFISEAEVIARFADLGLISAATTPAVEPATTSATVTGK